jgi:hypothetical protein
MKSNRLTALLGLIAVLILALFSVTPAAAGSAPAVTKPTLQLKTTTPRLRTRQEMEAAQALQQAAPAPQPRLIKPFLTPWGAENYKALKSKAALGLSQSAPAAPVSPAPQPAIPLINTVNFDGVDQSGAASGGYSYYPPDTEGAVGPTYFVETTNCHLDFYLKAAPNTLVKSVDSNSFLGIDSSVGLSDPRILYDQAYQRWVFVMTVIPPVGQGAGLYLAVSQTADPTGNYYVYYFDVSSGDNTSLWDQPRLGMDANALIITGDFYNGDGWSNFVDSRMFTLAKSQLYAGQTVTPQIFTGLAWPLVPPIVLDNNPNTYLLGFVGSGPPYSAMTLYTLTNSATNPALTSVNITVPTFAMPPDAVQPDNGYVLDSMDCRFANASTQIGNSLFQVHSVYSGGYARCRFYEFDTVNNTVVQCGDFGSSSTSYDFNPSLAANRNKDVLVTWSSTDPVNNINAQVRYSGRRHTDPQNVIFSPGYLLAGSATYLSGNTDYYKGQRWGDYSAVSLDPADSSGRTAWIVNETIPDTNYWGSRIGCISFPPVATAAVNLLLLED